VVYFKQVCVNLRLSGASPFLGDSDGETMQNVLDGEVEFPDEYFNQVSVAAKDLIEGLLIQVPRLTKAVIKIFDGYTILGKEQKQQKL